MERSTRIDLVALHTDISPYRYIIPAVNLIPRWGELSCKDDKPFTAKILYKNNVYINIVGHKGGTSLGYTEMMHVLRLMNVPLASYGQSAWVIQSDEPIHAWLEGEIVPDVFVEKGKEKLKEKHRVVKHINVSPSFSYGFEKY